MTFGLIEQLKMRRRTGGALTGNERMLLLYIESLEKAVEELTHASNESGKKTAKTKAPSKRGKRASGTSRKKPPTDGVEGTGSSDD